MTEGTGRTARWTAAALAAPVVAGGFAGVTAWALHHDPRQQPAAASQATAAVPADDPALAALRSGLAANTRTVDRLSRQVATVRAQAAALAKGGRTASTSGSSSRSSTTAAPRSGSSSSSSGSSKPAAAPAPPPPTHTTTGASGTKK